MALSPRAVLALDYAVRGWPVLPLHSLRDGACSCGQPCASPGKHPRTAHGLREASSDLGVIQAWWRQWPDAHLGLRTGEVFTVLDVDVKTSGDETLRTLQAEHGPLPATWRVQTGGGGEHVFFQPVPELGNSASLLGPGLDIRGVGGYVVAAGSGHTSGRDYGWQIGMEPDAAPLAEMPGWMRERLLRPRSAGTATEDAEWVRRLSGVPLGTQNQTATQLAGHLARKGLSAGEMAEILLGYGARCTPPITREDAITFRDIAQRIWAKEHAKRQAPEATAPPIREGWGYVLDHGQIAQVRTHKDQTTTVVPLCDFDCWIEADEARDLGDGLPTHTYRVQGLTAANGVQPAGRLPTAEVRAEEFAKLDWVPRVWGTEALVLTPVGVARHHLATAIQRRTVPARHTTYGHTGWRYLGGAWRYLHGAGSVGDPPVSVRLDPIFARFGLPTHPEPAQVRAGLAHLFGAVRGVVPRVMTPLLAAVFLAPLIPWHDTPFAVLVLGDTGRGKSSLLALCLSAYGEFPDEKTLPIAWSSTANYLEECLFTFKDHAIVIDDVSQGTAMADTQAKYERLLRAQANRTDRGRMRADGSLRPRHPPRGLLLISAQTPPLDEALLARTYPVEVAEGDVDLSTPRGTGKPLDRAQEPGGLAAMRHAMAAYLRWLQPAEEEATDLQRRVRAVLHSARRLAHATTASHARLPETMATVLLGWRFALDFAVAEGHLTPDQADADWQTTAEALTRAAVIHRADLADRRPARQYLERLQTLVHTRRLCFLPQARRPDEHNPPPVMAGWSSRTRLYLDPHASADLFRLARDANEPLAVTEAQVMAELLDAKVLEPGDDGHRLKNVATLGGASRRVYILDRARLAEFLGEPFDPGMAPEGLFTDREPGDEEPF